MARTEARIKVAIWRDEDWLELDQVAKLAYFTILSQPKLNLCGVISFTPRPWARLMGVPKATCLKSMVTLAAHRYVVIDEDTEELWVRTFIKNDGVLDTPNVIVAMTKDYSTVQSEPIRQGIVESIADAFPEGLTEGLAERFPKAFEKGMLERFDKGFRHDFPEGSSRAHARSLQSPVPGHQSLASMGSLLTTNSDLQGSGSPSVVDFSKMLKEAP